MTKRRVFAPAKVNLTLHVTGQRPDGYHLLDSLVVFADVGDWLTVAPGPMGLRVTGPRAEGVPQDARNLAWKAAELMDISASITLEKHLPAAAGIGGGSSDAAAVLRALQDQTGQPIPDEGLALGADVPVCVQARAAFMRGIGEQVELMPNMPKLAAVLVNPGVEVPTGAVFNGLERKDNSPMTPFADAADLLDWLRAQRNDLEPPACAVQPVIAHVLEAIAATDGCQLARMSGSGATCFGLFADGKTALAAAQQLQRAGWWVQAVTLS